MIKVTIIQDSYFENERVITLEFYLPKFLDAEFEKHGLIASNSSSDRALQFGAILPFLPSDLRKECKGMESLEQISDKTKEKFILTLKEMYSYVHTNLLPFKDKIHHQHLNRYILPWNMQKKVATANDFAWEAFIKLRTTANPDPIMFELATEIAKAIKANNPIKLEPLEWHLPYVNEFIPLAKEVSAARCARVSYNTSSNDIERDLLLCNKLVKNRHLSPLEHQLTPICSSDWVEGVTHIDRHKKLWSGRHRGFIQFRKLLFPDIV